MRDSSVIASEAKQSIARQTKKRDCFVATRLAMTASHAFAISPHLLREFCQQRSAFRQSEGAGNAGRSMRPQPHV
jgi:hypothetical protein